MTHASLAKLLGYSSPQLLYNISKGITKNISVALSERLLKAFPYYNRGWLLLGEGGDVSWGRADLPIKGGV